MMKLKDKLSDWRYRLSKIWLFDRLETAYYRLKYGVINLYTLGPAIWTFRAWDSFYFLEVIIAMLEQMEIQHAKYAIQSNRQRRIVKQIRLAKALCKRAYADDYPKLAGYDSDNYKSFSNYKRRNLWKHEDYLAQQDMEYLGRIFKKHLRSWWD